MNGIESKRCVAVVTNNWLGFQEIVVMMTGKKRVNGVLDEMTSYDMLLDPFTFGETQTGSA